MKIGSCLKTGPAGVYKLCHMWLNLYIFDSSAYKYISELGSSAAQSSGRSFMYIKNNKGPNMLPDVT